MEIIDQETRMAPGRRPVDRLAVALRGVRKVHRQGRVTVRALGGADGVDLGFSRGSFTAVMGQSGSGKSTLLQCAAGLDKPTSGAVWLGGADISGMRETELTKLRRTQIGFVFQAYNLVSALTVRENILLPLRLAHGRPDRRWVNEVVTRVGLDGRLRRRPAQLSGGEQQRVSIARALAVRPEVVFCDEPTGALDTTTAGEVLTLLRQAADASGQTVIMVTHDPVAASYADRVVFLADGEVVSDVPAPGVDAIAKRLVHYGRRQRSAQSNVAQSNLAQPAGGQPTGGGPAW